MSVVVLLPGLICDKAVWRSQAKALNAQGYETIVIDYGRLSDLREMASLALRLVPQSFILIGHSMGGRIAMEIVRQAPERVCALAAMDTGYLALAEGEAGRREVQGRMELIDLAKEQGMRAMGKRWMQGMVLPEHLNDAGLCEEILDMIERFSVEQFAGQQNALINRPDASGVLSSLERPTCFICGDQDAWSPLENHHEMAKVASHALVYSIPSSGHMTTMEQPEKVNEVLSFWLEGLAKDISRKAH